MSFHGCNQAASTIGSDYYMHAGYNQWAENNRVVVVYPQTVADELKGNPDGCWYWWGYTNKDYAFKTGVQMATVDNMLRAFA